VNTASLVILVMFNVLNPHLAPDLDDRALFHFVELDKDEWRVVALGVLVRIIFQRETFLRVVLHRTDVVNVAVVLK